MQPQLKNNVSLITVRVWQDGVENIRRIHPQNFLKKLQRFLKLKYRVDFVYTYLHLHNLASQNSSKFSSKWRI